MSESEPIHSRAPSVEAEGKAGAEIAAGSRESHRPGKPPASGLKKFFSLDNRFLAPLLITCILLGGQFSFGILESWTCLLTAIGTSVVFELVLGKWMVGKFPHLASAYISGISVGILIRSTAVWPYALCAALSIVSKYVLRWHNRHLWNPSNFGVSAMLFIYPSVATALSIQWGNFLWPMVVVWSLGAMIIYRLRRFHICLTYVISFICFSWLRSLITGHPFLASVAPLTGPMYQLFVFFMITDPRTTVRGKRGQCLVVFLVALVEMVMRLGDAMFSSPLLSNVAIYAPFYSLFLVGPIAFAIELGKKKQS